MDLAWKDIGRGDRNAFSAAYLALYDRYYNYATHLYANNSVIEDAIQETLISLWENRKELARIHNPNAYYFVLFRRALLKKIKELHHTAGMEYADPEPEFAVDSLIIKRETDIDLQQQIKAVMNNLTSRQREAIFLRFYEGFSYETTAAILDISVKATYKIVARALQSFKDSILLPLAFLF